MAANSFDNNAEKLQKIANVWDDTKTLVTDFGGLLNDEKYSDVLFIVGENEQEFRAHSLILKARCLKYQDEKSTANPIYKQTWLPDVFHNVLEYIYTGQVQ